MTKLRAHKPRLHDRSRPARGWLPVVGFAIKWTCVAGIWGVLIAMGVLVWFARELPDITRDPRFDRRAAITVLANDGQVIARYGDHKGTNIAVADLPNHMIDAVLAIEDRRFYSHFGIDPIGLVRALVVNVTEQGVVQGGSTITQQLAKNLFLSQDRTLKRKIQEALLAIWLEHELTKDEILSAYLNRVYMGSGAYGIAAASDIYFKKDPAQLTLRESAMLAGLLKAPSRFSPNSNPDAAQHRARIVIGAMIDAGFLPAGTELPARDVVTPTDQAAQHRQSARYFADWVVDQVPDLIGVSDQDLTIETTLDSDVQNGAIAALVSALETEGAPKNVTQGIVLVARPDGSLLAMVGGRDYNESEFNRATQALRSPGSSFKPLVYLAALEAGFRPDTLVLDEPRSYGPYRPTNFDGKYYGELTLGNALALSLNTVAVHLMDQVGSGPVIGLARRLGITADLVPNLSLALGSSGVSAVEMIGAYTVIANGGLAVRPYGIKRIKDDKGTILYDHRQAAGPVERVVRYDMAYDLARMMNGAVEYGTGQRAKLGGFVAGKTGTGQDYRDAWFSGFTASLIGTVWVGNDDFSPMKRVTGGSIPAGIWRATMVAALADPTPAPAPMISIRENAFDRLMGGLIGTPDPVTPVTGAMEQPPLDPAPVPDPQGTNDKSLLQDPSVFRLNE